MQIHVVSPNQTLTMIAQLYNTTPDEIIRANAIPSPFNLVVGEALLIPIVGSFYWVQPGDSLYTIARRFGLNYVELARVNGISPNQPLNVGQKLYIPPRPKVNKEINAYIEPIGSTVSNVLIESANATAPYLTYLAPFSFRILRDGSLRPPLLNDFASIAQRNGVVLMMVVTNLESGQFSAELGRTILSNENLQNTLIDNIIATAKRLNFKDIHFDMEFLPPEMRENYISFLRKAKARLSQEGFLVSAALAPKISATQEGLWYEAHDYEAIGEIVDFVVIMTYEWGYSGGPPMAVSPLNEVRRVVDYAVTAIPSDKILLGQNLYGYDWTLPYVAGGEYAKAISPLAARNLASTENVPIKFDTKSMSPYFEYTDAENREHIVWFEDARSIQAKFDLIKEYNLRGISYWKLGLSFPQNWLLIPENFNVVKRG